MPKPWPVLTPCTIHGEMLRREHYKSHLQRYCEYYFVHVGDRPSSVMRACRSELYLLLTTRLASKLLRCVAQLLNTCLHMQLVQPVQHEFSAESPSSTILRRGHFLFEMFGTAYRTFALQAPSQYYVRFAQSWLLTDLILTCMVGRCVRSTYLHKVKRGCRTLKAIYRSWNVDCKDSPAPVSTRFDTSSFGCRPIEQAT